jgi:hypothetical protein
VLTRFGIEEPVERFGSGAITAKLARLAFTRYPSLAIALRGPVPFRGRMCAVTAVGLEQPMKGRSLNLLSKTAGNSSFFNPN